MKNKDIGNIIVALDDIRIHFDGHDTLTFACNTPAIAFSYRLKTRALAFLNPIVTHWVEDDDDDSYAVLKMFKSYGYNRGAYVYESRIGVLRFENAVGALTVSRGVRFNVSKVDRIVLVTPHGVEKELVCTKQKR